MSIHDGIYPHKCTLVGCSKMVEFDDEPWCFEHSPDEGSSVHGYSAKAVAKVNVHNDQLLSKNNSPVNFADHDFSAWS